MYLQKADVESTLNILHDLDELLATGKMNQVLIAQFHLQGLWHCFVVHLLHLEINARMVTLMFPPTLETSELVICTH